MLNKPVVIKSDILEALPIILLLSIHIIVFTALLANCVPLYNKLSEIYHVIDKKKCLKLSIKKTENISLNYLLNLSNKVIHLIITNRSVYKLFLLENPLNQGSANCDPRATFEILFHLI